MIREEEGLVERGWSELSVQSVGIAVEILDAIAEAGKPVRLSYLAKRLNVSRARVHRYLKTLRKLGLVWQERSGERYGLGWKLFHLGQAAAEQFEIKRLVEEPLRRLRDLTDATVTLAVPTSGHAVTLIVERPTTKGPHASALEGKRLPPHATAQGRIALAFADEATRQRVLSEPLQKITERTLTDSEQLSERLSLIKQQLYDVNPGDLWWGYLSFAAPILDRDSQLHAIVAVLASEEEAPPERHPKLIQAVQRCAAQVSRELNSDAYVRIGIDR